MNELLARLHAHAHDRPEAIAYLAEQRVLTYATVLEHVSGLAGALRQRFDPGDVVILCAANSIHYPIAFLGTLAAGLTLFPVSADAAEAELAEASDKAGATGLIGHERARKVAATIGLIDLPIDELPMGESFTLDRCGDLLLQSSGTTGSPKIVWRSAAALASIARGLVEGIGFTDADCVLMTVPLAHSYGLEHGILAPLWAGSSVRLMNALPFADLLSALRSGQITILPGVPSTFEMLARAQLMPGPLGRLRLAYSAGGPLPQAVFEQFLASFQIRATQLYGASEVGSVTYNPPADPFDPASVGRPLPGVSVRIIDADDPRRVLGCDEPGEVCIRAASMFDHYLGEPESLLDGFFRTGDLGLLDASGRLFITGRIKLLIDVGGMKVNPLQVEQVLMKHPAVGSCVVVAVQQSHTVHRLKAIVTPSASGVPVPVDELRDLARQHLAGYKVPRLIEVRDELPRSATGKILRRLLSENR